MNTPYVIQVTAKTEAHANLEFETEVKFRNKDATRFQFKGTKGYAFMAGKSRPVIYRMEWIKA